mgnify:CR=1 FL=1
MHLYLTKKTNQVGNKISRKGLLKLGIKWEAMNASTPLLTVSMLLQTEAPLMIKPLLHDMTKSEMHAVMTGGFATIAGSVLATYILFGVGVFLYLSHFIHTKSYNTVY